MHANVETHLKLAIVLLVGFFFVKATYMAVVSSVAPVRIAKSCTTLFGTKIPRMRTRSCREAWVDTFILQRPKPDCFLTGLKHGVTRGARRACMIADDAVCSTSAVEGF